MLPFNPKIVSCTVLLAVLGGLIGTWAQNTSPELVRPHGTMVGVIAGALFGLTLGLFWVHQRRRWIAAAVVTLLLVLAYAFGGPWAAMLTAGAIAITLFASASILRDLYDGNEFEAFGHHMRNWFSMNGGVVVVDGGAIVVPATKGPHFGPRLVIVRPGNAVVLTLGSAISRICGPSVFQIDNFEYISRILPLTEQRRSLTVQNVMTTDHFPVDVTLTFTYGIDVSNDTIRGQNARTIAGGKSTGLTSSELNQLQRLISLAPEFEQEIRTIVQGATRNMLARMRYDQLLAINNYQLFATQIITLARNQTDQMGLRLLRIAIGSVSPRAEVVEAMVEAQRIRSRYAADSDGIRDAITNIAAGYRAATNLGLDIDQAHRLASRYMVEHMTEGANTKIVISDTN